MKIEDFLYLNPDVEVNPISKKVLTEKKKNGIKTLR